MTSFTASMHSLALLSLLCLHASASTTYQENRLPAQLRSALSTAPCRITGDTTVPHGQQIERDDPCEFCICIDSNVFCWWGQQHCTANISSDNSTDGSLTSWTPPSESPEPSNVTEGSSTTVSIMPISCIVMGKQYQEGAVLPRDTGTCLECVCGKGGRVTCSPKDCIRPNDDFHNSDPSNSLDMFDVDVF